ncbi:MATE family efflux transporter [Azospirillum halopraeferens]|uniref:MATE family efflux transporter n=1 Tax=Azospirillum halopraeferens TaxID=34010 RepID=UPI00042A8751|nr:MATE family efflux transporter [Azospirillum halopraeferens]
MTADVHATTPADRPAVPPDAPSGLRTHVVETVRLAAPVIVSRAGLMVMLAVDTAIVGRYGAQELAYFGLAHLPASMMIQCGVGLLLGTIAMTAHAVGAGNPRECGAVWRRSVPYALLLGVIMAALSFLVEPLYRAAGQAPDVAAGGAAVTAVLGLGMPGMLLYVTTGFFLEGLKRPVPVMLTMLAGNVLNAALAYTLVWGAFGLPALGALGSAWATTAVRWSMGLGLVAYVLWGMRDAEARGVRGSLKGWWRDARRQRTLGYAAGLSLSVESLAFASLGFFAGMISPLALGAYTIGLNLIALPFMAAVGLAAATAVRVGVSFGRDDRRGMALAGWTGLGVTSVFLAGIGVVYALVPEAAAAVYTTDPALAARVAPLIAFSAWVLVADGGQAVMGNALRGRNDAWVPTLLHFISYAVVMIPLSAWLAFGLDRGERGLFEGILIASVVSVTVLSLRFALLCRR